MALASLSTGAGATGITINQNTVENSVGAGIYLTGDAGGATVSQNLLSNNAVGVWVNAAATNVGIIQGNSFMGNTTAQAQTIPLLRSMPRATGGAASTARQQRRSTPMLTMA